MPAIVGRGTRQGHGVAGYSNGCGFPENCYDGAGIYGENTGGGYAVRGVSAGVGVGGYSSGGSPGVDGGSWGGGNGVSGFSDQRNGVQGTSRSRAASGVYGENLTGGGYGVAGRSNAPYPFGAAIFGDNTVRGPAGLFNGWVVVNGPLFKLGGGFQIDHPLRPADSYLYHSFVEAPDMMNVYNGNISTDADGTATVQLPDYFEALNRDFRYQLTVVGQFAQAIVAEEVTNNRFVIRTDKPNVTVSWQVTGIRQDSWANAQRIEAEVEKPEGHRGKYLSPTEYDQPDTAGIYYVEPQASEGRRLEAPGPAIGGIRTVIVLYPDGRVMVPFSAYSGINSSNPIPALTTAEFRADADKLFGFTPGQKLARNAPGWLTPSRAQPLLNFATRVAQQYAVALDKSTSHEIISPQSTTLSPGA
jgi:hypothetical protein